MDVEHADQARNRSAELAACVVNDPQRVLIAGGERPGQDVNRYGPPGFGCQPTEG